LGFSGKGSIMLALPPSRRRMSCARCRARYIPLSPLTLINEIVAAPT
jgi:hypothetical protein